MRNLINSAFAALLMLLASVPMMASNVQDEEPEIPPEYMPIVIRTEYGVEHQRSFGASFDLSYQSGTVVAEFYENIGTVSIIITNTDTGEMWNADLDSSAGISTVDISTYDWQGYYELMIVDGLDRSYYGHFEL